MRILFLTQVLPFPLDAGPKVRAYYVLRHLAERHEVTLVSFVRSTDSTAALDHLRHLCAEVYTQPMPRSRLQDARHWARSLITNQPFLIARDWAPAMADLIAGLVNGARPFDAIHADQLWMAPYARWARQSVRGADHRPSIVLDQHNAVYLIPQRMADGNRNALLRGLLWHESDKLARYEAGICRQFDDVVWVTQEDFRAVARQAAGTGLPLPNSAQIPICVDPTASPALVRQAGAQRVTFIGGLHYPPNAEGIRWFAKHVFPSVVAQNPAAVLTVIGKQPPNLHNLGIPDANLDVTGYVADPTPYLTTTGAFVVPIHAGGGMRVKILEGWMWGLPVVSTTIGAEGIRYRDGENLLLADTPDSFAATVVRLLREPVLNATIAAAGRTWVEQHYNWRTIYAAWDRVYAPETATVA